MTRIFSILLLILMSLQLMQSALAFNGGGSAGATTHFAQHDHHHADDHASNDGGQHDADSHCHHGHLATAMCPSDSPALGLAELGEMPFPLPDHFAPQHEPEPSDRPPIVSAA
ncbi:MAG: hypothetical protein SF172_11820 [Burkholderiales bacterium]|nr:hypothetical protein [Burkholderiales bacterium]